MSDLVKEIHDIAPPGEDVAGWQPIETAPKDGTLIDVWTVDTHDSTCRVRLTDVFWHCADDLFPHTGWARATDDGNWDAIEEPPTCELGLAAWIPTHWMPLPKPPEQKT